jgi:hypothetical protein
MTAKEFDDTLRSFLNRKPFQAFVVEYDNGDRFLVDGPHVAFGNGYAGFLGPNKELHRFHHKIVKQFLIVSPQEVQA